MKPICMACVILTIKTFCHDNFTNELPKANACDLHLNGSFNIGRSQSAITAFVLQYYNVEVTGIGYSIVDPYINL